MAAIVSVVACSNIKAPADASQQDCGVMGPRATQVLGQPECCMILAKPDAGNACPGDLQSSTAGRLSMFCPQGPGSWRW
jgi:hypothetical protein